MKRAHRKVHGLVWLLLLPLLLVVVYTAQVGRLAPAPAVESPPSTSAVGELP